MALKNVLFIGKENATGSVMAEAYMNHAGRGLFRAFSAGLSPAGEVHPLTLETLRDAGVRGRSFSSKSWRIFALATAPRMDVVVCIGDAVVPPDLPRWPGDPGPAPMGVRRPGGDARIRNQPACRLSGVFRPGPPAGRCAPARPSAPGDVDGARSSRRGGGIRRRVLKAERTAPGRAGALLFNLAARPIRR